MDEDPQGILTGRTRLRRAVLPMCRRVASCTDSVQAASPWSRRRAAPKSHVRSDTLDVLHSLQHSPPVQLTPREKDKLLVAMAAEVARRRLARGVKLNHPEAIALISDFVVEGARDGRPVSELMSSGASVVSREQVMDGIAEMIPEIQVEATFPDGTKLVTVHRPIR